MDKGSGGGSLPSTYDGAFERFLTAAIAAIITIMFSWRLLDDMNDDKKKEEEREQRRAADGAVGRQVTELDIEDGCSNHDAYPLAGDPEAFAGDHTFHVVSGPSSAPFVDSGFYSLDDHRCNSLKEVFVSSPPLYLRDDAQNLYNAGRLSTFQGYEEDDGTGQAGNNFRGHALRAQSGPVRETRDASVNGESDDETFDWPLEVDVHVPQDPQPLHHPYSYDADPFSYDGSGQEQPRELDSVEELFCCNLLEPIMEEDSDDLSSSGEQDRILSPLKRFPLSENLSLRPLPVQRPSSPPPPPPGRPPPLLSSDLIPYTHARDFGHRVASAPSPKEVVEGVFSKELTLIPPIIDSSPPSLENYDSESDESVQTVIRRGMESNSSSRGGSLESSPVHLPTYLRPELREDSVYDELRAYDEAVSHGAAAAYDDDDSNPPEESTPSSLSGSYTLADIDDAYVIREEDENEVTDSVDRAVSPDDAKVTKRGLEWECVDKNTDIVDGSEDWLVVTTLPPSQIACMDSMAHRPEVNTDQHNNSAVNGRDDWDLDSILDKVFEANKPLLFDHLAETDTLIFSQNQENERVKVREEAYDKHSGDSGKVDNREDIAELEDEDKSGDSEEIHFEEEVIITHTVQMKPFPLTISAQLSSLLAAENTFICLKSSREPVYSDDSSTKPISSDSTPTNVTLSSLLHYGGLSSPQKNAKVDSDCFSIDSVASTSYTTVIPIAAGDDVWRERAAVLSNPEPSHAGENIDPLPHGTADHRHVSGAEDVDAESVTGSGSNVEVKAHIFNIKSVVGGSTKDRDHTILADSNSNNTGQLALAIQSGSDYESDAHISDSDENVEVENINDSGSGKSLETRACQYRGEDDNDSEAQISDSEENVELENGDDSGIDKYLEAQIRKDKDNEVDVEVERSDSGDESEAQISDSDENVEIINGDDSGSEAQTRNEVDVEVERSDSGDESEAQISDSDENLGKINGDDSGSEAQTRNEVDVEVERSDSGDESDTQMTDSDENVEIIINKGSCRILEVQTSSEDHEDREANDNGSDDESEAQISDSDENVEVENSIDSDNDEEEQQDQKEEVIEESEDVNSSEDSETDDNVQEESNKENNIVTKDYFQVLESPVLICNPSSTNVCLPDNVINNVDNSNDEIDDENNNLSSLKSEKSNLSAEIAVSEPANSFHDNCPPPPLSQKLSIFTSDFSDELIYSKPHQADITELKQDREKGESQLGFLYSGDTKINTSTDQEVCEDFEFKGKKRDALAMNWPSAQRKHNRELSTPEANRRTDTSQQRSDTEKSGRGREKPQVDAIDAALKRRPNLTENSLLTEFEEEPFSRRPGSGRSFKPLTLNTSEIKTETAVKSNPVVLYQVNKSKENKSESLTRFEQEPFRRRPSGRMTKSETRLDQVEKPELSVRKTTTLSRVVRLEQEPYHKWGREETGYPPHATFTSRQQADHEEKPYRNRAKSTPDLHKSGKNRQDEGLVIDSFLTRLEEEPFSRRHGRRRSPAHKREPDPKRGSGPDLQYQIMEDLDFAPLASSSPPPRRRSTRDTYIVPQSPTISVPAPVHTAFPDVIRRQSSTVTSPGGTERATSAVPESPTIFLPSDISARMDRLQRDVRSTTSTSLSSVPVRFEDAEVSSGVEAMPRGYTFTRCQSESTHTERRVFLVDRPLAPDFETLINAVPFTSEGLMIASDSDLKSHKGKAQGASVDDDFDDYSAFVEELHRPMAIASVRTEAQFFTGEKRRSPPLSLPVEEACILSGNLMSPPIVDVFTFPSSPPLPARIPAVSSVAQNLQEKQSSASTTQGSSDWARDNSSREGGSGDVLDNSFDTDDMKQKEKMQTEEFAFIPQGTTVRLSLPEQTVQELVGKYHNLSDYVQQASSEVPAAAGKYAPEHQEQPGREEKEEIGKDKLGGEDSFEERITRLDRKRGLISDVRETRTNDHSSEQMKSGNKPLRMRNKPNCTDAKEGDLEHVQLDICSTRSESDEDSDKRKPNKEIKNRVRFDDEQNETSSDERRSRRVRRQESNGDRGLERKRRKDRKYSSDSQAPPCDHLPITDQTSQQNRMLHMCKPVQEVFSELHFDDGHPVSSFESSVKIADIAPVIFIPKNNMRTDISSSNKVMLQRENLSQNEEYQSQQEDAEPILFFQPAALIHKELQLSFEEQSQIVTAATLPAQTTLYDISQATDKQDVVVLEDSPALAAPKLATTESPPHPEPSRKPPPRPKPRHSSLTKPVAKPRSRSLGSSTRSPISPIAHRDDGEVFINKLVDSDVATVALSNTDSGDEDKENRGTEENKILISGDSNDEDDLLVLHKQSTPQSTMLSAERRPRSLKELRRQKKSPRPMIAPFTLPDHIVLPSRLRIQASRCQFLSSENVSSVSPARSLSVGSSGTLQEQFEAHKQAQQQARERRYKSANRLKSPTSPIAYNFLSKSQDQLEKLNYLLNYSRHSESSLDRSLVEHLHENCILTPEGRRDILNKTLSIENLHVVDLSSHLRKFGSVTSLRETDLDTGQTQETNFFPETNLDAFDSLFQAHEPLGRSASMSDLIVQRDCQLRAEGDEEEEESERVVGLGNRLGLTMTLPPATTYKNTGKGRFSNRYKYQHGKSKSLCTLETNIDEPGDEGSTADNLKRIPSVHELRVTKSLQKLNVPDWFKQSSLSKSSSCLLKYGSNSTMNSFFLSPPSLLSSPCASTAPPAPNVIIKTRVVPSTNPRSSRTPASILKTGGAGAGEGAAVKLPSDKLREKEKSKGLMPIPIVPFSQIRAMFEKKAQPKQGVKAEQGVKDKKFQPESKEQVVKARSVQTPIAIPSISVSTDEGRGPPPATLTGFGSTARILPSQLILKPAVATSLSATLQEAVHSDLMVPNGITEHGDDKELCPLYTTRSPETSRSERSKESAKLDQTRESSYLDRSRESSCLNRSDESTELDRSLDSARFDKSRESMHLNRSRESAHLEHSRESARAEHFEKSNQFDHSDKSAEIDRSMQSDRLQHSRDEAHFNRSDSSDRSKGSTGLNHSKDSFDPDRSKESHGSKEKYGLDDSKRSSLLIHSQESSSLDQSRESSGVDRGKESSDLQHSKESSGLDRSRESGRATIGRSLQSKTEGHKDSSGGDSSPRSPPKEKVKSPTRTFKNLFGFSKEKEREREKKNVSGSSGSSLNNSFDGDAVYESEPRRLGVRALGRHLDITAHPVSTTVSDSGDASSDTSCCSTEPVGRQLLASGGVVSKAPLRDPPSFVTFPASSGSSLLRPASSVGSGGGDSEEPEGQRLSRPSIRYGDTTRTGQRTTLLHHLPAAGTSYVNRLQPSANGDHQGPLMTSSLDSSSGNAGKKYITETTV